MQGSIQKKNNTYYAVIALDHKKRKWVKGGKSKKDAQRVLREALFEIDNGVFKEIPRATFKEFADIWLERHVQTHLKASTAHGYRKIVTRNLSCFNDYRLSEMTTGQLQAYVAKRSKAVSAKTVCNDIMVMKKLFKHARKWGYVKISPAEDVDRPKVKSTEVEVLDPDEFKKLMAEVHPHYQTAFLASYLTGLRAGELWGLQWGDIDWNSKKLFVRRSMWKGGFDTPKTKKSFRKVDMP